MALRADFAQAAQQASGPLRRVIQDLVRQIDQHVIVGSFTGPTFDGNNPNVTVSVETGDASISAAADRRTRWLQDTGSRDNVWVVIKRDNVTVPVGPSIRIVAKQDPAPGVVSRSVEYVLFLDGVTVSLAGTAPFGDPTLITVMDKLAQGVVRH